MLRPLFIALFLFGVLGQNLLAQKYVDKQFDIETEYDIEYGVSTDFAGNERTLKVNLIQPIGDTIPDCGRPLLLLIHGGAFLAGSKDDAGIQRLGEDFARRGYAVATLNYRLGQFQTNQSIHCNASNLGLQWDCLNMTDSSEWYRAWYRGVQDAKGAIRYLITETQYPIDQSNVFTIGESAGGFIALGLGYLDEPNEVLPGLASALPDVLPPNAIYESPCIQHPDFMLDTSIASMDLSRPDLGSIDGSLNPLQPFSYRIQAVGNLYGAVFNDIFGSTKPHLPALFTYHQPADLIVPIGHQRLFAGYNYCATQFPFNCANIINRPFAYGSNGIVDLIENRKSNGLPAPEYEKYISSNNANCAQQVLDPNLTGHAIHNYEDVTRRMAVFFAGQYEDCFVVSNQGNFSNPKSISISPNPVSLTESVKIHLPFQKGDQLEVYDLNGRKIYSESILQSSNSTFLGAAIFKNTGMYILRIQHKSESFFAKIVVSN
jgi:hypothetical protein